jgi:hypothetical protein
MKANETHQLPLPPNCEGETDWTKIKNKLKDFLKDEKSPIVFVKQFPKCYDLEIARKTLQKIWNIEGVNAIAGMPRVCALDVLLYIMAKRTGNGRAFESVKAAQDYLARESLVVDCCWFHTKVDRSSFCCKSR